MWLYWRLFLSGLGILGRRRRDLILENLILAPAARRLGTIRTPPAASATGPAVLVGHGAGMDRLARPPAPRSSRYRRGLAPSRVAALQALEESGRWPRSCPIGAETRALIVAGGGESHLGRAPHRCGAPRPGAPGECGHGVSLPWDAGPVAVLADLPAAACAGHLGRRLRHRPHAHLKPSLLQRHPAASGAR